MVFIVKKLNRKFLDVIKKTAELALVGSANTTSSGVVFQPKAPNNLRKYSKLDNDK